MDRHGFATYRTTESILARKEFRLQRGIAIQIAASTRRLLRIAAQQQRTLARIERIRRRLANRATNLETRAAVKEQRRGWRNPTQRVRTRDNFGYELLPKFFYRTKTAPGKIVWYPTNGWYAVQGDRGHMTDFKPVVRLDPPRNLMWAGRERRKSLSASARLVNKGTYAEISVPKCKFGDHGIAAYTMSLDVTKDITFDPSYVNQVLIDVQAKVYSADIQMNEYVFEWHQVFRLLKDPYRTVLRTARLLQRWTRRDAWIWIPARTARRAGHGTLVSKAPLGGVLMSMRTREFVDPVGVSDKVLKEACNRWLMYRYGIMPLAKDITTVMGDWLSPKLKFPMKSCSARVNVSRTIERREYTRTVSPIVMKFIVTKESGEFYAAKQWYKMLKEPPMSYKTGMHPKQIVATLWNALPYSFVVDWSIDINRWLTATTDVSWINLHANVVTRKMYQRITSRLVDMYTTSSANDKFTLTGDPIAIHYRENVKRDIDLPRAYMPYVSQAWRSLKNAITALTLLPGALASQSRGRRG